jgi:hypothetical protein
MTSTNNTYIPDMNDWVSYYGNQTGSGKKTPQMHGLLGEPSRPYLRDYEKAKGIPKKEKSDNLDCESQEEGVQELAGNKNSCTSCGLIDEMSTDIQVLSPVQMAVNQAMATKRRRISKKKRKSGGKKAGKVRKRSRRPKVKRKRQKIKKTQRDIFNY